VLLQEPVGPVQKLTHETGDFSSVCGLSQGSDSSLDYIALNGAVFSE
jgi:hypothetical protein